MIVIKLVWLNVNVGHNDSFSIAAHSNSSTKVVRKVIDEMNVQIIVKTNGGSIDMFVVVSSVKMKKSRIKVKYNFMAQNIRFLNQ